MAMKHVGERNTLYRIFYYDCYPLDKKYHNPISKRSVDFRHTEEYDFKMKMINALKRKRKVALRMGTLKDNGKWLTVEDIFKSDRKPGSAKNVKYFCCMLKNAYSACLSP